MCQLAPEIPRRLRSPDRTIIRRNRSLTKLDLIDEYHLMMQPTILGGGLPLFGELDHRVNLRLVKNTALGEKIAALHYERVTG